VYSLCALLGDASTLKSRLGPDSNARVIELTGGLGMVPLSESLLRDIQRGWSDSPGSAHVAGVFEFLTGAVENWARALSSGLSVAYMETEYFGGEGFERSVVFRDSNVILGPLDGGGAVNRALRVLGVVPAPGQEEFDAAGLGRHHSLEEWLSEA
jgi:hypothetical protein